MSKPFEQTPLVSNQKIVVCDINPNNNAYRKVMKAADMNLCTHFKFGSWYFYNSLTKTFEPRTDIIPEQLVAKEYAQEHGAKTILNFGSVSQSTGISPGNWSIAAADAAIRAKLTDQMVKLMEENEFDALSVDWWYSGCPNQECAKGNRKDKENLVSLMKELYKAIKERGKLLFLILPTSDGILNQGYDMNALWNNVDYFYVNTYTYEGTWNDYLGYSTNLLNVKMSIGSIKDKLGAAKMKKVIAGFSSSVTLYTLVKMKAKPKYRDPVFPALSSYTSILNVCEKIQTENYSVILDGINNNLAHNTTHVYVFEDFNTLKEKVNYFKSNGLGGMIYAGVSSDDDENKCGCGVMPMLRIASELLHGGGCSLKQCIN
ncbi:Hypothetical predicted protein [Cloeon dipterum]|uniref:GH18 domain-containing protein n=1 Tax=Cloeon dipterum TaxID=197152 RepID=A0A8S1DSY9_9INSE|nr:Hypothetical predicted protein [Cloeon dipterum]